MFLGSFALGNMPDLSPESFKRTSLMLDAVIQADPVRHERGGSTGKRTSLPNTVASD